MSASSVSGTSRGRVSILVARAQGWLVEPLDAPPTRRVEPPEPPDVESPRSPAEPWLEPADIESPPIESELAELESRPAAPEPWSDEVETWHDEPDAWPVTAADEASLPATAPPAPARPVVAVVGLAPRCGTTTVARWVATVLAARDPDGAAIVATAAPRGTGAVRTRGAARLARRLGARSIGGARAAGRLCLVESADHSPLTLAATYLAPVVIDAGHGTPAEAALSVADHVLLVASPSVEPALGELVAQSVARAAPEPSVVLNRAQEDMRWDGRADVVLPESRLSARRAGAGWEARGAVGAAVAELAAGLEESTWG